MFSGPARTSWRTVDDLPRIEIRQLRREGAIPPGAGSVMVAVNGVPQTIALAWRPGSLGLGEIVELSCARCRSRRRHLYLQDGTFACRACLQLGYPGRLNRSVPVVFHIRRLRRKLGASPAPLSPLPSRKGRVGTAARQYDRLVAEIARLESELLCDLGSLTAKLERHDGYGSGPGERRRSGR
jgi:hypothetical protein